MIKAQEGVTAVLLLVDSVRKDGWAAAAAPEVERAMTNMGLRGDGDAVAALRLAVQPGGALHALIKQLDKMDSTQPPAEQRRKRLQLAAAAVTDIKESEPVWRRLKPHLASLGRSVRAARSGGNHRTEAQMAGELSSSWVCLRGGEGGVKGGCFFRLLLLLLCGAATPPAPPRFSRTLFLTSYPPPSPCAATRGTAVWVITVNGKYQRVAEGTPGAQQMTGAELGRECS